MNIRRLISASVVGIFALPITLSAQTVGDTLARIDSLFARIARDGPGCAVGVKRDGAPTLSRAYGMASLEYDVPIAPGTVFNAASIAKQFTAASVILLADQRKLSLDDDVRKHVPELPAYGSVITLRHLMQNTSGLRDAWELLWLAGGRDDDPLEDDDVLPVIFRQRALNFRPGSQYLYSNTNFTLLALIVRRVAGTSLKEFAAQHLFGPAGMTQTFFRDNRYTIVKNGATGYRPLRGGARGPTAYLNDVYGSGGLFTTVEDLLRWYEFMFARTDSLRSLAREAVVRARLTSGDSVDYSTGLELGTSRGLRFVGHGGNDPGASAYVMRFIDRGLSVTVLCNTSEFDAFLLARQTAALFLPSALNTQATTAAVPAPAITLPASQLQRYAGIYFNPLTMATRTVEVRNGQLAWVRGSATPLEATAPNRFRFPPGQPAELLFPPVRGQQEMHLLSGGTTTIYYKARPFVVSRSGMKEYAGRFTSDEADVTLTIEAAGDSAISFSTLGSWRFRAEPVFRDAFAVPEAAILRFTRNANGIVDGMVVDMSRSRNLRFRKLR